MRDKTHAALFMLLLTAAAFVMHGCLQSSAQQPAIGSQEVSAGGHEPFEGHPHASEEAAADTVQFLDFKFAKAIAVTAGYANAQYEFANGKPYGDLFLEDTMSKTLSTADIRRLDKTLKGNGKDPSAKFDTESHCFATVHSILFLDEAGQPLHYISFSPICGSMRASKPHHAKIPALRALFEAWGHKTFDDRIEHLYYYESRVHHTTIEFTIPEPEPDEE